MDSYLGRKLFRFAARYSLLVTHYSLLLFFTTSSAKANGEIAFVRAPEQIPAGDEVTVIVSASARETNIDRTLALEYPDSWKMKRAWRVEAGSDHAVKIAPYPEVTQLLSVESGRTAIALTDFQDFDPDADGIAYFIVFSTNPLSGKAVSETATVKAALIERTNPDAPLKSIPKQKSPSQWI